MIQLPEIATTCPLRGALGQTPAITVLDSGEVVLRQEPAAHAFVLRTLLAVVRP